jgi:hypothetical protein
VQKDKAMVMRGKGNRYVETQVNAVTGGYRTQRDSQKLDDQHIPLQQGEVPEATGYEIGETPWIVKT